MKDITGKDHCRKMLNLVKMIERDGREVILYKACYEHTKAVIDGYLIDLPNCPKNPKDYYEHFLKGYFELADEMLLWLPETPKPIDDTKHASLKRKLIKECVL